MDSNWPDDPPPGGDPDYRHEGHRHPGGRTCMGLMLMFMAWLVGLLLVLPA